MLPLHQCGPLKKNMKVILVCTVKTMTSGIQEAVFKSFPKKLFSAWKDSRRIHTTFMENLLK